jgi:hypothetical protein
MVATAILAVALVAVLATGFSLTGKVAFTGSNFLTPEEAGKKAVNWIENYFKSGGRDMKVELINASDTGIGVYKFTVKLSDSSGSTEETYYVSMDGNLFFPQVISTSLQTHSTQTTQPQQQTSNIPKKDRPTVELYIFSYCPAGTSALNSFAPVGKLLGNKTDMRVKFFSNMHGDHELQQNEIQECIQENEPYKYWDYASSYVQEVYNKCGGSRDVNCDKSESINLMKKVGINAEKIMNCVKEKGDILYSNDKNDASKFNLQYSPSLVINDFSLGPNFDRSSEGIKNLICSAFTTQPSECSQPLSSSGSTASGGCG